MWLWCVWWLTLWKSSMGRRAAIKVMNACPKVSFFVGFLYSCYRKRRHGSHILWFTTGSVSNRVQSWLFKISDQYEQMELEMPLNVLLIVMGVGITEIWTQCSAMFSSSLCRSLLEKDGPGLVTLTLLTAGFLFSWYFEFHRNAWIRSVWMPKIMSTQDMKCQNLLRKELHTSGTALQGRPTIAFTLSLNFDIWVVNFVGSILYIYLIMSNLTF